MGGEGILEREVPSVNMSCERDERGERRRLRGGEGATGVIPVPRHDDTTHEWNDRSGGRHPVERVAIAGRRDVATLDQVAREQDIRPGDRDDDVVIGMTPAEVSKLQRSATNLDRGGIGKRAVRWVDDHFSEVRGEAGLLAGDLRFAPFAGSLHERHAAFVAPDGGWTEQGIAKDVIEVTVRVNDHRYRKRGQVAQVAQELPRLWIRRAGIDDQRLAVSEDHPDVLVVERIAANEDAVANFDPAIRHTHRRIVSGETMSGGRVAYAAPVPSIVSRATVADGTDLLVRHWPADEAEAGGAWAGQPWASVLIVHGLGDHSGRYEHVGDQLAAAGLDVWAYDSRGNGSSGGRRGHVDRWSKFHDDLESRLRAVRASAEGHPVVLYGHSMGGLVVAGYLTLPDRPMPDLAVLTAPGLDSTLPGWKKSLARVLGGIAPNLAFPNDLDPATLSRDPSVGERSAADPANAKTSTVRFGAEALAEQERVRRDCVLITVPTLVLHGDDDGLVPVSASEVLATVPAVERRTYPGLRHELQNEPEGPQVLDEVIAWIRERATVRT
jgi:acylglycerol lipase